jgi:RNA polymerase sigma-70 factor (ECF subfamily)
MQLNGQIDIVLAMRVEGGLITGLQSVRNPEKLSRVEQETH